MKCFVCHAKNKSGNFCDECGAKLKEACPKCGQLEPIGRPDCMSEVNDVMAKIRDIEYRAPISYPLDEFEKDGFSMLLFVVAFEGTILFFSFKGMNLLIDLLASLMISIISVKLFRFLYDKRHRDQVQRREAFVLKATDDLFAESPEAKELLGRYRAWAKENE